MGSCPSAGNQPLFKCCFSMGKKKSSDSNNEVGYFLHNAKPAKEENIKQAFKRTTYFCILKKDEIEFSTKIEVN